MVAPSPRDRGLMLLRDRQMCVSCMTRTSPLEAQHRRRVGAGGSKVRPPLTDLATACSVCNAQFESRLQVPALVYGWKVRAWVQVPGLVPMFNAGRGRWGLLQLAPDKPMRDVVPSDLVHVISPAVAIAAMRDVYGGQWDEWASKVPVLRSLISI